MVACNSNLTFHQQSELGALLTWHWSELDAVMLLKLYFMFYSKWFLEKIGHRGTRPHHHCFSSPPYPLPPTTVLVHLLTLFSPQLCLFTSSPSPALHCFRSQQLASCLQGQEWICSLCIWVLWRQVLRGSLQGQNTSSILTITTAA